MRRSVSVALNALLLAAVGLIASCGGGPSAEQLASVDYTPETAADWPVSTPADHGLDPDAVAELYWRAGRLDSIYSLLVVKGGDLIAEDYFSSATIGQRALLQSATKSITGALVGIAVDDGCLSGVDEPMMTYFPELQARVTDPRLNDITIEQLLQFRAGYAWEESSDELLAAFLEEGYYPWSLLRVPLVRDPGTGWDYSNLSSHLLSIVTSRACDTDLLEFADDRIFGPLGIEPGDWTFGWEGYRQGQGELRLRARDMAKFGQLYLDGGAVDADQLVSAWWIEDSWTPYTESAWYSKVGNNFDRTAYGYQWWIIDAGPHTYYLAWGHGGQQIAVVPELDMVVVVTADPLVGEFSGDGWSLERANLNLVADFVAALPEG